MSSIREMIPFEKVIFHLCPCQYDCPFLKTFPTFSPGGGNFRSGRLFYRNLEILIITWKWWGGYISFDQEFQRNQQTQMTLRGLNPMTAFLELFSFFFFSLVYDFMKMSSVVTSIYLYIKLPNCRQQSEPCSKTYCERR